MLTSPTRLLEELNRIHEDISLLPGRRVALLGFRDSNAQRVADNVSAVQTATDWTVVDARPAVPDPASDTLESVLAAPALAMIVDASKPLPADAGLLIGALHDARDRVRWADESVSALPEHRILYVIASGAQDITELPGSLKRIDFMAFIEGQR